MLFRVCVESHSSGVPRDLKLLAVPVGTASPDYHLRNPALARVLPRSERLGGARRHGLIRLPAKRNTSFFIGSLP